MSSIEETVATINRSMHELALKVQGLQERSDMATEDRRAMQVSLAELSTSVNQLIGRVERGLVEQQPRGWLNPQMMPWVMAMAVIAFAAVMTYAMVFGDAAIQSNIERLRNPR